MTWKGIGVSAITSRGRDGEGRPQVPGWGFGCVWGGFEEFGVGTEWVRGELGWIWGVLGGFGVGYSGCPRMSPGEVAAPKNATEATSPPLPICRGGKCAAVVEESEDSGRSCRVWVSRRCPEPSTGFQNAAAILENLIFSINCFGQVAEALISYFFGSQKAQPCAGSCS